MMDSMINTEEITQVSFENYEELDYGEALAHVISAASVLKGLGEFDETAREVVLKYFDLWLEAVKPIRYKDGLAEVIGERLKGGLVELLNSITEDELSGLLSGIVRLKLSPNLNPNDVKELLYYTSKLLEGLGVSIYDVKEFINYDDPRLLLDGITAVIAVTLGIVLMRG